MEAGSDLVYVVPVQGTIETGLARFIHRAFDEAGKAGAGVILLEIGTLGGRVDAALEIRDLILSSPVPVVAFVRQRAWSAGALIAIAANHLAMAPGSSIGSAEPVPKNPKIVSALRAEFEATAQARGRDPGIAAAMVDAELEIPGLVRRGELLNLTAARARELGYAAVISPDRVEVLESLGYPANRLVMARPTRAESLARMATHPVVAPVLLTLGLVGLVVELLTPGWGIGGIVGLVALALFFGGHMLAGMAGWEVVVLFLLGAILLGVEALVPGFGVFGTAGIVSLVASIILASGDAGRALPSLLISLVATAVLTVLLLRVAGRQGGVGRFVLRTALDSQGGYLPSRPRQDLLNKTGYALTPLRPAGKVSIEGERVDAVADGSFLPAGATVRVVKVEGNRVVVEAAGDQQAGE